MRFAVLLMTFAAFALPAAAQEPGPLKDLQATRLNDSHVALSFSFDGSACQKVLAASSGGVKDMVLTVVIPTERTAEMCTMQIVPVPVETEVNAGPGITAIKIEVMNPDRGLQAAGEVSLTR